MKVRQIIWVLLTLLSVQSLSAKNIRPRKILRMIKRSVVLKEHFTGFALYDLSNKKMLVEQNSDKYFTPASNTKLFTFYAGLRLLKDSIAGLNYIERGDSLIFWGMADPSFLHPDFTQQIILDKLNSSGKNLFWANGRYTGDFYGVGWSYDDYNEYYQPEISELPVYGNIIRLSQKNNTLFSSPALTQNGSLRIITDSAKNVGRYRIRREVLSNDFHQPLLPIPSDYTQDVPFKVNTEIVGKLLKVNIPNFSGIINYSKPPFVKTWHSIPSDTLFKRMLLPSDNFIAEQILLNIAAENGLEMNTSKIIEYVTKNFLADLPDRPQWVDGSGLSRQNLFTPRDMVKLCEKIYKEIGNEERLFNLLPLGGKTGTLRNLYKGDNPFVFAKTGSLSNNCNLSGFLITRSGQKLIFSFMNNNYIRPTAEIRSEMERIIRDIYQNY